MFRILDSSNFSSNHGVKNTMVDILKLVLGSNRSPLGISSTELLGYLLKHLRKSVRREFSDSLPEGKANEKGFQDSLLSTIGNECVRISYQTL